MEYYNVYNKRLNRYGSNFQERIQGGREANFEDYLNKSVYRVTFEYNEALRIGSLEPYSQDDTKTLQYLLVDIDLNIPGGTVLQIPDKDGVTAPWMVYYLESMKASGYNRYFVLKMSHFINWHTSDGTLHESWVYLYGKKNSGLRETIKSTKVIYSEDEKDNYFIMPRNQYIQKDQYISVGTEPFKTQFRVTGYDYLSTEGVEYVTLDPIYEFDLTPAPTKQSGDNDDEFYWLNQS